MAGKAVAVAKAAKKPAAKKPTVAKAAKKPAAKKPTVAAKKPTVAAKKPTVAKAAKKPAVAKATGKKPAVAKFNLNKLMMLIVRDAPKKGKKMMGGVKSSDSDKIRQLILNFIGMHRLRITTLLNKVDKYGLHADMTPADITADITTPWEGDLNGLILHIYTNKIVNNANTAMYKDVNNLQQYLISNTTNYPKKDDHSQDKSVLDDIFMTVVIALCNVYGRLRITQNP